jgi:asparagine synthase (glutamine-hydrolysing)
MVRRQRDASLIFIEIEDGAATRLRAWKGLLAGNEVYFAHLPEGGLAVSDHFRNVVSAIPVADRAMSTDAVAEHYISGWVHDRGTHSAGVQRLANGDRLDLDLRSGEMSLGYFDRIESVAVDEPDERHLERVDNALEDVIAPMRSDHEVSVAFSGGVDSTLLLSYMDGQGTPLTMVPDTPEFGDETEYARGAARLLGRDLSLLELKERDYLRLLEEAVETMATPIRHYVSPMTGVLYRQSAQSYLLGEGADSVFGSGRGIKRVSAALSARPARAALSVLESVPGLIGGRARQIGGYAASFAEPTTSPAGAAGRALDYYGDTSLALRVFGSDTADRLFRKQLSSVLERVAIEVEEKERFHRHTEIYFWRNMFADASIPGRHIAHAQGKRVVMPFITWRVVSESLKIPARRRYNKGLAGKWILKRLLRQRVPEYKINQRKLATGLPFTRFYETGPLAGIWDRYDVPDVIPSALRQELVGSPTPVTWHAITHAIWTEKVVRNAELRPHPAKISSSWPIAGS